MASIENSVHTLKTTLWWAVPGLILLVGLIAWGVTGRALRPVETIRAEVTAISHTSLDHRVSEPRADDEVGRLARTMNEMLDRLQDASDRQRQFVSDASHELRSPVARSAHGRGRARASRTRPTGRSWCGACSPRTTAWSRSSTTCSSSPAARRPSCPTRTIDLDDVALEEVARARRSGITIQSERGVGRAGARAAGSS